MTSADELIRSIRPAVDEQQEIADVRAVRAALDREVAAATSRRLPRGRMHRGLAATSQFAVVAIACAVAIGVAAVVLVVAGGHRSAQRALTGPPAGPAADGLTARLAVMRRPQTAADRLPAGLIVNHWPRNGRIDRARLGEVIPTLTRLVAKEPGMKIYLVVTTPATTSAAVWPARDGDQVGIIAVTRNGATETEGYPAAGLADASQASPLFPSIPQHRIPVTGRVRARTTPIEAPAGGDEISIVPDGVAQVRWTFAGSAAGSTHTVTAPAIDNVAVAPIAAASALQNVVWRAPDGTDVPTSDRALQAAITAQNARLARAAVREARRLHITAPRRLLKAFPVFGYDSPSGTRTSDGYTISHPPLSRLPLDVLRAGGPYPSDLSQVRLVRSPSGLQMWVIPGTRGVCVFANDPPSRRPFGPQFGHGAGSSCSVNLRSALDHGGGLGVGTRRGTIQYVVLPPGVHTITIQTAATGSRTIHSPAGVYIGTASYRAG